MTTIRSNSKTLKTLVAALSVAQLLLAQAGQAAESKPKYGPKEAPRAQPLVFSPSYFQSKKHPAPDFWSLIGFYVPQMNEFSCSAASVAMVLNAARAKLPKTSEDAVITQPALLEKVAVEQWKQRLSAEGAGGEHGTSLPRLGKITEAAFKAYGFPNVTVKVVHVENTSAETKRELVKALVQNEKSSKDFIIANFNQQAYTDDADAGHIAPVGAYDAEKDRVLVLDPDREYYEPYWISTETFLAGMATKDKGSSLNRGYLVIQLNQP